MFIFLTSVNVTYKNDFDRLDSLITQIADGDKQAFSELYGLVKSDVYGYALSILKNSHDSEDILQNCFIKIWDNAFQYKSGTKPMAWILTVTKNLCYMKLREQKRDDNLDETELSFLPDDENISLTAENRSVLEAAFKVITSEERQIVMLHAVSGLKFREISELVELPLATVLSKYHRAIQKMKSTVGGEKV